MMLILSDYEQTIILAVRYGLMTDHHSFSVNGYVLNNISNLSNECIEIIADDIKKLVDYSTIGMVKADWMYLLERMEEELEHRHVIAGGDSNG